MVEHVPRLDIVFGCLADATRRDILKRVTRRELSVNELAEPYDMTLAAVSKHLKLLEDAKLVVKKRRGQRQLVHLAPAAFKDVEAFLRHERRLWEGRLDRLEAYLKK